MSSTYVDVNDLPAHISRHVSPAKMVRVVTSESVSILSQQWSEGTRSLYHVATLDATNPTIKPVEDSRPWPQNMGALGEVEIAPGCVIITTGTFCGKPATPVIYARAEDVAKQLEKPKVELSHVESQVLYCLASYNSSGRKRFRDDFRMTKTTWDELVSTLAAKGLATPRGSVTIDGRNRASSLDSRIVNPYSERSKA